MRRIFVPALSVGEIKLPPEQAHHLLRVLRIGEGEAVEVFDAAGATGAGCIAAVRGKNVFVRIETMNAHAAGAARLAVASAIPKGARADWMIEKLSELGVDRFIPLITERAVVVPEGRQKILRWQRLAQESAEQSHRTGLMTIDSPARISDVLKQSAAEGWKIVQLSIRPKSKSILESIHVSERSHLLLIGPEGGWSESEEKEFENAAAHPRVD